MDLLISPRRRALLQALGASALLGGCGDAARTLPGTGAPLRFSGATMGTTYTVKLGGPGSGQVATADLVGTARQAVAAALGEVVRLMSTYDPESELSRFNRHRSTLPFAASGPTSEVLAIAGEVSAASRGAFDVTVGPAVDAWGFGPPPRLGVPDAPALAAARTRIGYQALRVDRAAGILAKEVPALAADLSGIAKGYAVDQAARALDALGIPAYMIEVGGEIRTRGANADGHPWQIGIERPHGIAPRPHYIVPLSGLSMATSGDYRNFFEHDGVRYSHEIDPASGAPVRHALASVTVIAEHCVDADAWSTALFVLGPDAGYELAARRGLAALFLTRIAGGDLREQSTPAFATLGGRPAAA